MLERFLNRLNEIAFNILKLIGTLLLWVFGGIYVLLFGFISPFFIPVGFLTLLCIIFGAGIIKAKYDEYELNKQKEAEQLQKGE